jgi:two-component system, chemotaxis family, protein-glutamate methylesterase/glutaminase
LPPVVGAGNCSPQPRAERKQNKTGDQSPFSISGACNGGRVAGVVLTGTLDDGVAGLAEIKRRGGVAVVQDPDSALYPGMPLNALKSVDVDYVVPLSQIAALVSDLVTKERVVLETEEPMQRNSSHLTCPECRGPLWEERQGRIVEYSCRVGHRFTPLAMEAEHRDTVERSLWSSVVALEEAAEIAEKLAPELGEESMDEARQNRNQAAILKDLLDRFPSR